MKTYEIVGGDLGGPLSVIVRIDGVQSEILGPYTTRDNATRRIRKEKLKDEAPASNEVAAADVSPEDRAFINSGRFPDPVTDGDAFFNGHIMSDDETATYEREAKAAVTARAIEKASADYETPEGRAFIDATLHRVAEGERRFMHVSTTPAYQIPRGNGYRPAHRANRFKSLR